MTHTIETTLPAYSKTPDALLREPEVSMQAKAMFALLDSFTSKRSPKPFPSIALLGQYAGASERSVRTWLSELADAGWIVKERRSSQAGAKSNQYVLSFRKRQPAAGCATGNNVSRKRQPAAASNRQRAAAEEEPIEEEPVEETPHAARVPPEGDEPLGAIVIDPVDEPKRRRSDKRGARLTEGWLPDPAVVADLAAKHPQVDVEDQVDRFRTYWLAEAGQKARKLDWNLALRTWVRKRQDELDERDRRDGLHAPKRRSSDEKWAEVDEFNRRAGEAMESTNHDDALRALMEDSDEIRAGWNTGQDRVLPVAEHGSGQGVVIDLDDGAG